MNLANWLLSSVIVSVNCGFVCHCSCSVGTRMQHPKWNCTGNWLFFCRKEFSHQLRHIAFGSQVPQEWFMNVTRDQDSKLVLHTIPCISATQMYLPQFVTPQAENKQLCQWKWWSQHSCVPEHALPNHHRVCMFVLCAQNHLNLSSPLWNSDDIKSLHKWQEQCSHELSAGFFGPGEVWLEKFCLLTWSMKDDSASGEAVHLVLNHFWVS